MVLYGAASGPVPPFDLQRLKTGGSLYLTRPTLGTTSPPARSWCAGPTTCSTGSGRARCRCASAARYPLAEAARAHEDLAARRTTGKLLLLPS